MKTYCKEKLMQDREFCFNRVKMAFKGKWHRWNYQKALSHYCNLPVKKVHDIIATGRKNELEYGLYAIVDEFQMELRQRHFEMRPIHYQARVDGLSGKTRVIGIMSVKQQCIEHIIVGALMPLFDAKIERHQYASIEGRGQVAGMKQIRKWVRSDNYTAKCAHRHNQKYDRKCAYFVKLDIAKCFPSITGETVMKYLKHDISKNDELLWAVNEMLKTHEANSQGLVIGSLLSQFICNYLLSHVYRFAMGLHKIRRGKRIRFVSHALFFMDDAVLFGAVRSYLFCAIKAVIRYAKAQIGLTVKPNWHIRCINDTPVDMMGYIIHYDGHVTIRKRIFKRLRAAFLRAEIRGMTVDFARRLISYHSFLVHTNSRRICLLLQVPKYINIAKRLIRRFDRKVVNDGTHSTVHRRICPSGNLAAPA